MESLSEKMLFSTGLYHLTLGNVIMWAVAFTLIFLAINRKYEPLLLLPIGFGIFIVNLPLTNMMAPQHILGVLYHYGLEWEIIPPLIFLGLGAMTDFGPLIANPKTLLLGAAAQFGVYIAFFSALTMGFTIPEACSIGIIGGADGPTTIFTTVSLAPHLLGATAVAAYSYMAMVPIIQPPIMRLCTTKKERLIRMKQLKPVNKKEKIFFPLITCLLICLFIPASASLMAMFMLGNLFRESGVVERLSNTAQNELMNIITIFMGLAVGGTMSAEKFLTPRALLVFAMGLVAFTFSTIGGIMLAKLMNLVSKDKINPLIGAAGVSAVPMSARVVQSVGAQEDPRNFLLMHAMGPNVAGVIGTVVAAGLFLTMAR